MQGEHIGELKKWAAEVTKSAHAGGELNWGRAIDLIARNFGVHTHEVAILGLTPDERSLRFLSTENLRIIGQVPLSSTTSLVARTVREQRPELINHFSVVRHASVFEAVPISESQKSEAIQKIMSVPIMVGKKAVGVVQVSRKGATAAEAGADFTHAQLRELKTVADLLAPCLALSTAPSLA